jgi:hypothetical protein
MTVHEPSPEIDARFGAPGAQPTPWKAVQRLLDTSELFWISTVRTDGRPHVTPLPAVWVDDALHFCTGPGEQKGVNLVADPRCALTTGNPRWNAGLDVVVEGTARRITDDARLRLLADAWAQKYDGDWAFDVADGTFVGEGGSAHVFAVAPDKVLAFAKGAFAQTRFRF